jgi:hypothetical protein
MNANALAGRNAHCEIINITITQYVVCVSQAVEIRSQAVSSAGWIRQPSLTAMDFHGPFPQLFAALLASGPFD